MAFLELFLGALASGVTALPLNPQYTESDVSFLLADSGAKLAIVPAHRCGLHPNALPAADVAEVLDTAAPSELTPPHEDAIAVLLYTSGTTGRPKGACIRHRNLMATIDALHQAWGWTPEDVLVHALPLFHVHGLFVAQLGALRAGATSVWMPRFDALLALRTIERVGGTVFMGVPTFYNRLLGLPPSTQADLASMRLFTSGSAPLPAQVHRAFHDRFGHRILERYGMTEIGIVLSNPLHGERRPGSVGLPLPGVAAGVFDAEGQRLATEQVGEVRIAGPSVFAGYLGNPEQTQRALGDDGWMRTGDLGYVDSDGYFHLCGRRSDLVITGGMNVYPREVEAVLLTCPGVAEAAVVGIADDDLGERVVAAVVAQPGAALDAQQVRAYVRERVAGFRAAKEVRIFAELPRNAMGKVQKNRIRAEW